MSRRLSVKVALLVVLALLCFGEGLSGALISSTVLLASVYFVGALVTSLLLFAWYRFDSDDQRYRRSWMLNIAIILVPVPALIYYLIRTRGLGRGLLGAAGFAGFAIGCVFFFLISVEPQL